MELQFVEELPENTIPYIGTRGLWQPIADRLIENPDRWALVKESVKDGHAQNIVRMIRKGTHPAFQGGSFEAEFRVGPSVNGTRRYEVYARYTGDEAS